MKDERQPTAANHTAAEHAAEEHTLRQQARARWGNVIVRTFTRKADGTLISVTLQDRHVPRTDDAQAKMVSWYPSRNLVIGDQKSEELFEWFETQQASQGEAT